MTHRDLVYVELGLAAITFVVLLFVSAPYGRHARSGWGPTIGSRLAWVVMEAPAVFAFAAFYFTGDHALDTAPLALLAVWQIHYVHRALIFPFRIRARGKRTPVLVPGLAIAFNMLNAYVNARWVSHLGAYPDSWLTDPRMLGGVALFAAGFAINVHADSVLINLRKPGETGYKVPRGGVYRWVTSANYFGELLEWTGWAIATWSLAGVAFAVYTAANLIPRALTTHRWYHDKFDDYPPERKAVIPYLL